MQITQNDCGATLIEQLGALLLGTIIIAALFAFYRTELFHLLAQETRMATLEDARGAMDIISRDLKLAGSWGTGSAPSETGLGDDPDGDEDSACNRIYRATERVIQIQMDLNGNGNCADLERAKTSATSLARQLRPALEQPSFDAMVTAWSLMRSRQTQASCLGITMRTVHSLAERRRCQPSSELEFRSLSV
jgi:Tfp pilus assembly protein PilW